MREVLISIQPKWCELIANGKKTVEVRKTRPKIETPFKVYIYCTVDKRLLYKFDKGERIDDEHFFDKHVFVRQNTWIRGHFNPNKKVIGEFVCQGILNYECEFVDDDCYESIACIDIDEDGDKTGFIEWSNDGDFPYEDTFFYKTSRVGYEELKKYIGLGFGTFYGWHISDLVIYDEPKELHHFFKPCGDCEKKGTKKCTEELTDCRAKVITRPPQSWCYVEGGEQ